jgi:hypothetical protein
VRQRERCAAHTCCPLITPLSLTAQQSHVSSSSASIRVPHSRAALPLPLPIRCAHLLLASLLPNRRRQQQQRRRRLLLLFAEEVLWERVYGELRAGGPGLPRLKAAARG